MQIVEQNLEKSISEKLQELPVNSSIAFFVNAADANYARTRITEIHKNSSMKFRTKKGTQSDEDGIFIWRIQ